MNGDEKRYEISVLIGPCPQSDAERAMRAAHEAADAIVPGPGTALNYWSDEGLEPGPPVEGVEVL